MKIEVNNKELYNAIGVVSRAVTSKSAIPVLEGILIKTMGDKIYLAGYDLDIGITTEIPARVFEAGEIVINSKLFLDIVRSMPGEYINFEVTPSKMINVTSKNSDFSIVGIDATEYPEMPIIQKEESFEISESVFKKMIRQTSFAVAQIDIKPVLKGVLFEMREDSLKLVAVDGYRLAMKIEKIKNNCNYDFIVPGKTLGEISKVLSDDEEKNVEIIIAKRHISFKIDNFTFISRLIDGEFLNYDMAIPKTATTTVVVDTLNLIDMVERVSLLINDRTSNPISCIFEDGSIKAFCSTAMGKATDNIESKMTGDRIDIAFNNKFLIDALKACEDVAIKLEMNSSRSPIVIKPLDGDNFLFLILPIMVRNDEK